MSVYGNFALKAMQDYFSGKTVKALIVGTNHTQVKTHATLADVSSYEIDPSGNYLPGGIDVGALTFSFSSTTGPNGTVYVDCADITFPVIGTGTAYGVIFYVDLGSPTASRVIAYDKYDESIPLVNALLVHTVATNGFMSLQV